MIKREWKKLFNNKILMIVLVAIIIIPTIYTTLFLGSMWDPYGQLDCLPVAVVNNDKAVIYDGKKLNIGQNLVDNLKENKSLKFNFLNDEQAKQGLENGTFYMVITIPENFSKNASTLMDDNPQKMVLSYETNPGTNYIASKLSESAMEKIKSSLSAEITKTYAETVFDKINDAKSGIIKASDGSKELLDGMTKLDKGSKELSDNLKLLADSSLTFKNGSEEFSVGLSQYIDGVTALNNGALQLTQGINKFSLQLSEGEEKLIYGTAALDKGIKEYTDGVKEVQKGVSSLEDKSAELSGGASELNKGAVQLQNGSNSILNGLNQISSQIGKSINKENQAELIQLQNGMDSLNQGIQNLNTAVQNIETDDFEASLKEIESSLNAIGISTLNSGENLKNIQSALTEISKKYPQLSSDENFVLLMKELNNLSTNIKNIGISISDAENSSQNMPDINEFSLSVKNLKSNMQTISDGASTILPGGKKAVSSLYSGLSDVKTALDKNGTNSSDIGIIRGMNAVNNGISSVLEGSSSLKDGINLYTSGVNLVYGGINTLNQNSNSLNVGISSLNQGINDLSNGRKSGTSELSQGISSLYKGTSQLKENSSALKAGNNALTSGALQIKDGANKLYNGGLTLKNGLSDASNGVSSLYTGLSEGADEIKHIKASNNTFDMFSSPLNAEESITSDVKNNGHAMAAYMMSVALWVGCIAFCIMYPLTEYEGEIKSGFSWWKSKASVVYLIAAAMAVVMLLMLHLINGFEPVQWGKTIIVALLASVSFMSIMYFFNVWLGKVGSFIMLIFMVVQLAGSAGTYPIELSGGFVAKIHDWLPFSYTVNAFRSTISGNGNILNAIIVLSFLTVLFTLLTILIFKIRAKKIKENKSYAYQYIEKMGLA